MGCNCGKPKCDGHCGVSPAVLQINNPSECVLFRKVEVPASMGTSVENPPKVGAYRNVLLYYNADGEAYLYSSDGMPTKITGTTSNYEILTNKPKINGVELVGDKSLADIGVTDAINNALQPYTPRSELAEVAFSGSYNDLTNKPTIPAVNNATLTVTQNGTSAGTFTANASSDTTINLTDTTYSDFSGATSSVAGASGLVPAPTAGDEDKALKGDGTWSAVGDVVELFINMSPDSLSTPFEIYKSGGYGAPPITHSEMRELFTPSNKKIVVLHETTSYDGVYPVIGFCYDTTEFYIFDGAYSSTYYITSAPGGGDTDFSIARTNLQEKLTAGSNITISGNTISASVELVEMSYGESNAWAKFIAAYQSHKIVYCRASSNSNPATGSQTRKAFMAFVNAAGNPTEVEFQYVRSVGTKTSSQPVDQIFVYKLTSANGGTWTVETRDVAPKLAAGTNATVSYSSGTYTIGATVPTKTSDLTNDGATGTSVYIEESDIAPSELSDEGEFITLNGTTDCSILDTQLLGNAEQTGTPTSDSPVDVQVVTGENATKITGRNLANLEPDTSLPMSSVPVTVLDFGEDRTVTETTSFIFSDAMYTNASGALIDFQKADGTHQYRTSGNFRDSNNTTPPVNTVFSGTYTNTTTITFRKANVYLASSYSGWRQGTASVQIELGSSSATEYEPYQEQTYEVNLGKNLIPIDEGTTTSSSLTYTMANGIVTINGTSSAVSAATLTATFPIKLKAGRTYTLSANNPVRSGDVLLRLMDENGIPFSGSVVNLTNQNAFVTFTPSSDSSALRAQIGINANVTFSNFIVKPMLELGNSASSFAPYFTPIELAKIGDYQDYIWNDGGVWKVHKAVGKVVLDSSNQSNWGVYGTGTANWFYYWQTVRNALIAPNSLISNYGSYGGIGTTDTNQGIMIANNGLLRVRLGEELPIADWKTKVSATPMVLYYTLAEPVDEEITNEALIGQLEALADALGYDGVTNIISTSPGLPAILSVSTYTDSAIPSATRVRAGIVRIGDGIDVDDCGTISVNAQKAPTVITIDLGDQGDWSVVHHSIGPMLALGAGGVSSSQYDNRVRVVPLTPPTSTTFHNENTDTDMTLEEVFNLIESGEDVVFNNVPVGTYYDSRSEVYYPLDCSVNGVRLSDKLNYSNGAAFTGHVAIEVPSPQSLDTQWDYSYPIVASISIRKLVVVNGGISTTSYYLDVDGVYDGIVAD